MAERKQIERFLPDGWLWPFECRSCHHSYPLEGLPHHCPYCGGIYDFAQPIRYDPGINRDIRSRGLDLYKDIFPLPAKSSLISLGEGNTPLVSFDSGGRKIYAKCEFLNPTGSFKDRGSMVLVSALASAGVSEAVEDSSGNAGASFAAYAARAGIRARIFIPSSTSGPKRMQIEAYGAELVCVEGPRSAAADAVAEEAEKGMVYASHVYLPHGIAGFATIAFEIVDQLGRAPGAIIIPVGHGSLLLGINRGFRALAEAGIIQSVPQLVAVQTRSCAPIWKAYMAGEDSIAGVREGETIAEGIRIQHPPRGREVLAAIKSSGGMTVAVEEMDIIRGRRSLRQLGFYVEPTSAVVWSALQKTQDLLKDPVVIILTGAGFKSCEQ